MSHHKILLNLGDPETWFKSLWTFKQAIELLGIAVSFWFNWKVTKMNFKRSYDDTSYSTLNPPIGDWFSIKMLSYQYRDSHYKDKTVLRLSYLCNGSPYTGETVFVYWIGPQVSNAKEDPSPFEQLRRPINDARLSSYGCRNLKQRKKSLQANIFNILIWDLSIYLWHIGMKGAGIH